MSHHIDKSLNDVISQEDLLEARIIEDLGNGLWSRIHEAMTRDVPIAPGELKVNRVWIPGDRLILENDATANELLQLRRAIGYCERHLCKLKEQEKSLRRENGLSLLSLAPRFA